jgi:hypothetical protein
MYTRAAAKINRERGREFDLASKRIDNDFKNVLYILHTLIVYSTSFSAALFWSGSTTC